VVWHRLAMNLLPLIPLNKKIKTMKKFIMTVASCMLVFGAFAQVNNDKDHDKDKDKDKGKQENKYGNKDQGDSSKTYCFYTKGDGKMGVKEGDRDVTTDVKLSNGTVIKSDGTIMKSDGTKRTLKQNECVDANGEVVGSDMNKPYKKDDEKDYDNDGPK
jgi:hypothetical protein